MIASGVAVYVLPPIIAMLLENNPRASGLQLLPPNPSRFSFLWPLDQSLSILFIETVAGQARQRQVRNQRESGRLKVSCSV